MFRFLLQLLFNGFVFTKSDVKFCAQGYALRTEKTKFLANALYDALRRERRAEGKELVPPNELATWRSMSPSVNLDEFVELACLSANVFYIVKQSKLRRIKEELHRDLFVLTTNKLQYGRVQARDCDLGNLYTLVQRVALGIKEDLELLAEVRALDG